MAGGKGGGKRKGRGPSANKDQAVEDLSGLVVRRSTGTQVSIRDVFVDDCVAARLENPLDPKLRGFLSWLRERGSLVLSKKIVAEYHGSLSRGGSSTFIAVLSQLQREGREVFFSNEVLKAYKFSKALERTLRSNKKDWWHLKAVVLSPRRLAVSFDVAFLADINSFPGVVAKASRDPESLDYR